VFNISKPAFKVIFGLLHSRIDGRLKAVPVSLARLAAVFNFYIEGDANRPSPHPSQHRSPKTPPPISGLLLTLTKYCIHDMQE
jgi:hypothetical protein